MTGTDLTPQRHEEASLPAKALRYLGLHPDNPATWVLAALSRKYDLDPLLNEVAVISTKQGLKPYVTRDGLLAIAHRSGHFDGMTTEELRESEHGWAATVTVWRNDMTHGFTYSAGCGRNEPQATQGHGAEMALARAERRALHRAFNVPTTGGDWDDDVSPSAPITALAQEVSTARPPAPAQTGAEFIVPTKEQIQEINGLYRTLGIYGPDYRGTQLAIISRAAGREVVETFDVSRDEAAQVIAELTQLVREEMDREALSGVQLTADDADLGDDNDAGMEDSTGT